MPNSIQSREYSTDSGTEGISYITDSDGNPNVFNVKCNDDGTRWLNANWVNPDNEWNLDNEIVFRLRNSLHFSSVRLCDSGEFCFCSCPAQPPSILPMSSSWIERAIYFLSRNDFVSHKIISNSKSVFSFRIATATNGSFLSRGKNSAPEIASIISINKVSILSPTV